MKIDRTRITRALFARLSTLLTAAAPGEAIPAGQVRTATRRPGGFQDFTPEEQPALVLVEGGGERQPSGGPPLWRLRWVVYLYNRNDPNPDAGPGEIQNPLVDALEEVLHRRPTELALDEAQPWDTTLATELAAQGLPSGTVVWVRVVSTDTDLGITGDQASAMSVVEALVKST